MLLGDQERNCDASHTRFRLRPIEQTAVFLACDDSSYVTGIELCVDVGKAQV